MENQSEIYRANARHCREIAMKTRAPEDHVEFTAFAESWDRLANQIEHDQLLIKLIDELASRDAPPDALWKPAELSEEQRSAAGSLRRLAAFISDRFAAEPDADAA